MGSGRERIAVIGAGAAGLCAAKHLLGFGHDVVVFELGSYVGGLWVYQNDNGRSPAYRSLHINSEARVTGYRDFPLPEDGALFPSHEEIRAYLEAYADRFDVRRLIRFNSEVVSVQPEEHGGSKWRVRIADGTQEVFDKIVVANGHQAVPMDPPFATEFTGEYLHSLHYRIPEAFEGKDVLVLGTGNSGLDIAADVCTSARSTTVSARSPVLIMPRMMFGAPVSRLLAKVERPWVPWPVRRRVRELITRLVHGSMEEWGFRTPKSRTHPASHPTIFAHIAWDRIRVRPGVKSVRGDEIEFTDGRVERFDAMIAATGYEIDFPFLSSELLPVEGHRINLYRRMVHPGWPGLYFVGLFDVSGGANIRMMDVQCKWLAAVVEGQVPLPEEAAMREDYQAEQARLARLYPDRPRYGLELDPREYGLAIREDLERAKAAREVLELQRAAEAVESGDDFRAPVG